MYEIIIVQCKSVKSRRRFSINGNVNRIFWCLHPGKCWDRRFFHNVYCFSCCQHLSSHLYSTGFLNFYLYPRFTQCVALPCGPGHRQHWSMLKIIWWKMLETLNVKSKMSSFNLIVGLGKERNFWWEAVSHPCAKWRSPLLTRPLWFPVVGLADPTGYFNSAWAMWGIGDWGN